MPTLFDGSTLITITETDLFTPVTTTKYHTIWISLSPIVAADEYTIRVYIKDAVAGTERLYVERTFIDVQAQPAFYLAPILMDFFRVSMQKITGTDRTFLWRRGES